MKRETPKSRPSARGSRTPMGQGERRWVSGAPPPPEKERRSPAFLVISRVAIRVKRTLSFYERYTPLFVILALPLGVFLAKYIPWAMNVADSVVSKLIDGICFLAPIAIFIVLAPSLAKLMHTRKESGFAGFIILWFGLTRILAGVWAAVFTTAILRLPLLPQGETEAFGPLFYQNLVVLKDLLLKSVFFRAIWVAIIVGVIAYYHKRLYSILEKLTSGLETVGDYIEPFIPPLMLLLGAYIYSLPRVLNSSLPQEVATSLSHSNLGRISLLGLHLNINSEFGLVWVYLLGSILIGVGCFLWQGMQLAILKGYVRNPFSIKEFFRKYWMKVYPLAWSTSSEVVSMPLNMALIKEKYTNVNKLVRRLVVGLGAYLNINGTTMHVILLAGIVSVLVGYKSSLVQLLIGVPIIVLIGYGVPGIPGELVLFAIPMVKILNLPEAAIPMFMALYLALQVGLPDSFRTGANVTDNGIYAIGLNKLYNNRFASKNRKVEV